MKPAKPFLLKPSKARVAIVDSLASCRIGLSKHILASGKLQIAWASSTAREGLEKLETDTPDILVVEIQLTEQDGLEFIKNLRPLYPNLKILVHSSQNEDFYARRCLQAGAMGFLHKTEPMGLLLPAMETILSGKVYLSSRVASSALLSLTPAHRGVNNDIHRRLSDRELEIIMLMAQGDSCQDTSSKLQISPRTVQVHRTNIRQKLGLDSAARLHAYSVRFYWDALNFDPFPVGDASSGDKLLLKRALPTSLPKVPAETSLKKTRRSIPKNPSGKTS